MRLGPLAGRSRAFGSRPAPPLPGCWPSSTATPERMRPRHRRNCLNRDELHGLEANRRAVVDPRSEWLSTKVSLPVRHARPAVAVCDGSTEEAGGSPLTSRPCAWLYEQVPPPSWSSGPDVAL